MRIGFLGAGLIATYHSKSLRASGEDVTWAGVFDPGSERADAFARASGATRCATEAEVLDGCDAVYVCTWTSEHPRLVALAAERGLPVFCEKPLAVDLATARDMAATVAAAGITNQVGLVLRRSPAFALARALLRAPEAGRTMTVIFRDDQFLPVRGMYGSTWRADVDKAGAGTLLEHSIHDLDLLEHLLGPVAEVQARSGAFHDIAGIEDLMVATLAHAGGTVATLTSVWHDVAPRPSLRRVEIFCERRWISLEGDWFGPVRWTDGDGSEGSVAGDDLVAAAVEAAGPDAGANPDGAFVRAARTHSPAWPDFATAVRAHEVADAIYRSAAAAGSPVALP